MKNSWPILIGALLGVVLGYGLTMDAEAKTLDEFFERWADRCKKILD